MQARLTHKVLFHLLSCTLKLSNMLVLTEQKVVAMEGSIKTNLVQQDVFWKSFLTSGMNFQQTTFCNYCLGERIVL